MAEIVKFEIPPPDSAEPANIDPIANMAGAHVTQGQGAELFLWTHDGKLVFSEDEGRWYLYDGTIWRKQRKSFGLEAAHLLGKTLSANAKNSNELQGIEFARAVNSLASASGGMNRTIDKFDSDPFLAGEPSMTLNLRDGEERRPDPHNLITRSLAVEPSAFEDCKLWLKFLDDVTRGDRDLIQFLQRWCGYCLTGDTREHTLLFVYGPGGNGKSVFINVLTGILNDYAATAAMTAFTSSKGDKHPADLAMLNGARLVTASETEEGHSWDESRIKQITGGDPITARFMKENFFTYKPQFKLTIVGNHQPVLKNVDDALRRRFCMVPFNFKPDKPDRELEAKLRKEWPAILRWMITGCMDWQRHGLPRPASVLAANAEYFEDQDVLTQWLEESCETDFANVDKWERTSDLFTSWSKYAKAAGVYPGSAKGFSQRLAGKGYRRAQTRSERRFTGIQIIRDRDPRFFDQD